MRKITPKIVHAWAVAPLHQFGEKRAPLPFSGKFPTRVALFLNGKLFYLGKPNMHYRKNWIAQRFNKNTAVMEFDRGGPIFYSDQYDRIQQYNRDLWAHYHETFHPEATLNWLRYAFYVRPNHTYGYGKREKKSEKKIEPQAIQVGEKNGVQYVWYENNV